MKHIYLLILLSVLTKLNSQTLTQSFNEPVVTDIDKNYRLDTSAYTTGLPINISGNNCVWNFTNLAGTFPMIVDSFIAPSAALGATAHPSATFVQHRDNIYTFYRSSFNPQQTELLGGYSPSLTLTFTNSAIIAGYPVSYGYNLSDPVGGNFKYNSTNGVCIGNIAISANGLGTANLPNNISIPNVLCLKSVEILTLSAGVLPVGTFSQTIYNYYMPGKKFPILNVNYTTYQLLAGTPTITAFVYGSNSYFTVAGINGQQADENSYSVFPNPFRDQLFTNARHAGEENDYLFYTINGQLVLKTRSLEDDKIEKLGAGIYFLETKTRLGSHHQKIVKE